jgi:linoleoyl-CoA desaturase
MVEGTDYPFPDSQGAMEQIWLVHQMMTLSNFAPRNLLLSWSAHGVLYHEPPTLLRAIPFVLHHCHRRVTFPP